MSMVRGLVFMLMVDERFEGSLDVGECDWFEGVLGLGRGLGGRRVPRGRRCSAQGDTGEYGTTGPTNLLWVFLFPSLFTLQIL